MFWKILLDISVRCTGLANRLRSAIWFLKVQLTPKFQNIMLMVKKRSPANFSFLWGVEQVGKKQNVTLSHFLYKTYRKRWRWPDISVSMNGNHQIRPWHTQQTSFQHFSMIFITSPHSLGDQRGHLGGLILLKFVISSQLNDFNEPFWGLILLKFVIFSQLDDFNEPKSIIQQ